MATGSSLGRANSGSKGSFDFAADDILCSYDDFANQESFHRSHSDPPIPAGAIKVLVSTIPSFLELKVFAFVFLSFFV